MLSRFGDKIAHAMTIDAGVPRSVRRPMGRSWAGWSLAFIAPWALAVSIKLGLVAGRQAFWFLALMWGAIVFALACQILARRTVRRAAASGHLLCPECLYDLRTLDDAGTCPECGRAYEHDAVRATWIDAQRRLKRK